MKKLSLLLLILGFCSSAAAHLLVISDIDDTIKNSRVLKKSASVYKYFRKDNVFIGMPELYQSFGSETSIHYVSTAVKVISPLHRAFLRENGFPVEEGKVHFRKSLKDHDFKINKIKEIIAAENPSALILIGDNGEQDVPIYKLIQDLYPQIPSQSYIHLAYTNEMSVKEKGTALILGQRPFVTTSDLAYAIFLDGYLARSVFERILETHLDPFFSQDPDDSNGPLYIPKWMNCRDTYHYPDWFNLEGHEDQSYFGTATIFKSLIQSACDKPFAKAHRH